MAGFEGSYSTRYVHIRRKLRYIILPTQFQTFSNELSRRVLFKFYLLLSTLPRYQTKLCHNFINCYSRHKWLYFGRRADNNFWFVLAKCFYLWEFSSKSKLCNNLIKLYIGLWSPLIIINFSGCFTLNSAFY